MKNDHRRVYIFGAGASADAEIPVMSNFLDTARDIVTAGMVNDYKNDFECLFEVIHKLKGSSFYSNVDLNNIETVLSLLELGVQIGGIEDIGLEEMEAAQKAAPKVIGLTIDWAMPRLPDTNTWCAYGIFSHKLVKDKKTSLITFNYDCLLDLMLGQNGIAYDYALKTSGNGVPLLKLHGSVNWSRDEDGLKPNGLYIPQLRNGEYRLLCTTKQLSNNGDGPFIIPPVLNKLAQQQAISSVWKKAAEVLRNAQEIYVIGYSLPETDTFFKYLFTLGTHSKASISRFWVFDPDPNVGDRFRELVGVGLREPRFDYFQCKFKDAIEIILGNKIKKDLDTGS